jgi:hypothetical protein
MNTFHEHEPRFLISAVKNPACKTRPDEKVFG